MQNLQSYISEAKVGAALITPEKLAEVYLQIDGNDYMSDSDKKAAYATLDLLFDDKFCGEAAYIANKLKKQRK